MATGRNNKLTGQVEEFLVCAELGRRGLIATPFAGNVPAFDVLAADELCRTVPLQVKASTGDNWPADARDWMNIDLDTATGRQNFDWPADARDWMNIELDAASGRQNFGGAKTIVNPDLIYVCVSIAPPASGARDRFFVLCKRDVQAAIIESYSLWMDKRDWIRPRNPASFDSRYYLPNIEKFEDNWQLIAAWR